MSNAETKSTSVTAGARAAESGKTTRMNVTPEECMLQTTGVFTLRPDGYGSDCVSCLCAQNPLTVGLCDDQADLCWGLIGCSATHCSGTDGIDAANCAIAMCGQFIEGSGLAMAVGALLQGDACKAKCPAKASSSR